MMRLVRHRRLLASVLALSVSTCGTGVAYAFVPDEAAVGLLIEEGVDQGGEAGETLEGVDFGTPGGFVLGNNEVFDEGTKQLKEKFARRFGGVCPVPDDDEDDDEDDEDEDGPPQPPPLPPNPPVPKPRPGGSVITPSGDPAGEIIIELIDAEAEVTVNGSGFNPLDINQVTALGRQELQQQRVPAAPQQVTGNAGQQEAGAVNNNNAGNANTGNTGGAAPIISSASDTLGPPPDVAYFFIDPITDTIRTLPSAAGSNLAAGTDNPTDAFVFPFNTEGLIFDNPAITPGSSIGFPVGTTYENILRNTNTGDRYRIRVTVNATNVTVQVEKL